jgi:signal transduction histidine kinase
MVVIVPVAIFALAVRKEMGDRLTTQYRQRVTSMLAVIEEDLTQESALIARTLASLGETVVADNRFRRAAVGGGETDRQYLLNYAGEAMRLTGLAMLQIQDESGRIISSGHFRNEYDRMEPELPRLLSVAPGGVALVGARTPEAPFVALAGVDSFRMAGRRFTLVGGVSTARRLLDRLAREEGLSVSLVVPGVVIGSDEAAIGDDPLTARGSDPEAADSVLVQELAVPFVDAERGETAAAYFRVTYPLTELLALRRSIDIWFAIAVGVTALVALVLAGWLSARMSRPLAELAGKTSRIDLDRLDIDFRSGRKDEIGSLSRLLGAMTERLRASAGRIKEAERRATLGELARQVNHDIKNGLMPIRNVFRHLAQVTRETPNDVARVFDERQGTIDSSIAYLEDLASNYARLSPRFDHQPCDVNAVVRQVVTDARGSGAANVRMALCDGDAVVRGDAVALRRIVENLVDNAADSLGSASGTVEVSTDLIAGAEGRPIVRLTVADTGCGMSEEQAAKVFDDFYTTKATGTGLGLSIVRRLVMDLNGSVRVESEPGAGSRFIIEIPGVSGEPEIGSSQAGGGGP